MIEENNYNKIFIKICRSLVKVPISNINFKLTDITNCYITHNRFPLNTSGYVNLLAYNYFKVPECLLTSSFNSKVMIMTYYRLGDLLSSHINEILNKLSKKLNFELCFYNHILKFYNYNGYINSFLMSESIDIIELSFIIPVISLFQQILSLELKLKNGYFLMSTNKLISINPLFPFYFNRANLNKLKVRKLEIDKNFVLDIKNNTRKSKFFTRINNVSHISIKRTKII